MTAATQNVSRPRRDGAVTRYGVAANVQIHQGTIVQYSGVAAGPATPAVSGETNVYLGVSLDAADNRTGAAGDLEVDVIRSGAFYFPFPSGSKPALGAKAYVDDDQTVSSDSSSKAPCGIVIDSDEMGVWVLWGASDISGD